MIRMIIGVTGLARSGKDTFALYLAEKFNFKHVDFFRDVICPILKEKGMKESKKNAKIIGDSLRTEFGKGVFAKKALSLVKKENYVISGFRSIEEVNEFKKKFENFILIYVESDVKKSFKRANETKSFDEFIDRNEKDIKNKGLGKVIELANYKIENNSTLDEFYAKIKSFLKKIQ